MALAYRDRERERDWEDVSRSSHHGSSLRRYPISDRYNYDYDDRESSNLICAAANLKANIGQPCTIRMTMVTTR